MRGGEVRRPRDGRCRGDGPLRPRHRADEAVRREPRRRPWRRAADQFDARAAGPGVGARNDTGST